MQNGKDGERKKEETLPTNYVCFFFGGIMKVINVAMVVSRFLKTFGCIEKMNRSLRDWLSAHLTTTNRKPIIVASLGKIEENGFKIGKPLGTGGGEKEEEPPVAGTGIV